MAKGSVRLVTLAVVCEQPRRVTSFVRHGTCVDAAFSALVLKAHGGDADSVPVVGAASEDRVADMRAIFRRV